MSSSGDSGKGSLRGINRAHELALRERGRLLDEVGEMRGLLPLLLKPRHHRPWSRADKLRLYRHFKRLSRLSPYLLLLILPGGLLALPALAWWLARRRAAAPNAPE